MKRSKKMLSRLTNFVHNAVEALAPEMTHLEQFRYHWKSVTQFFLDTSDERMSVESTSIPHHIEQMLFVLLQEEQENGTTSHGPSMEFMLQHKILETMQTLGRADCPPGMKRQVLMFFTQLLGKSKQQLLPHVNAHKPVNKLIRCCGEVKAAPTESEEVAFLLQVSSKLKQDSYLVNFFLEKPSSTENGSAAPLTLGSMEREREKPEYSLVDALLALTKSEDSRVAIKACEGLILVTSIPEDNAASVIVLYTAFCERMADQLSKLFKSLPAVIDPYEMNQLSATWGFDNSEQNMAQFPGKRQMIAFFSWLDYVNQLSVEAHPMVSQALAFAIRERYIMTAIEPGLSQASEPCAITVTALLTRCLKLVTSPLLAQEFAAILLGTDTNEEGEQSESPHKIRHLIIHRINHISDQLAVETLRLFQALLQLPYQPIMDILVSNHFKNRNFIDQEKVRFNEEMLQLTSKSPKASSPNDSLDENKTNTDNANKSINNETQDSGVVNTEDILNELEIGVDNMTVSTTADKNDVTSGKYGNVSELNDDVSCKNDDTSKECDENDKKDNSEIENCSNSENNDNLDNGNTNLNDSNKNDTEKSVVENPKNEIDCVNKDSELKSDSLYSNADSGNDSSPSVDATPSLDEMVHEESSKYIPISESKEKLTLPLTDDAKINEDSSSVNTTTNVLVVPEQGSIQEQQEELWILPQGREGTSSPNQLSMNEDRDLHNFLGDTNSGYKTFSKKRIEKVVNGFLLLFPEALRTSELIGDVGYDSYLRDAHKQCEQRAIQSFQYHWPVHQSVDDLEINEEPFFEGDFLNSILKRLMRVLDQPFDINLEVTAIISLLCQFQHPYLHEYLMDTADTVKNSSLNPHVILKKVCQEMKVRAARIPSCQALLLSMRKNLNQSTSNVLDSIPEESFFQAVIILEEFCKELAAIAFVTATQNEECR